MKKYTIPKGRRRPRWRWPIRLVLRRAKYMTIHVRFTDSVRWEQSNGQWNKLAGMSYSLQHHRNSKRIVWRWNDGHVEIGQYEYINGKRTVKVIGRQHATVKRTYTMEANRFVWYTLGPYFGGKLKAPHDTTFYLDIKYV